MGFATVALVVIGGFLLLLLLLGVKVIRPYQKGLVERLGKFNRILDPGIHFIIPFMERVKKVDMREHVIDVPPQEVICKDNVVVTVDAVVYYQILDPVKAVYNVSNFLMAIIKLAQTNLRAIIGEMELDETLSGRDIINARLREELDKITDRWGVKITRVEIQRIDPPKDIQEAMAKQMTAEREKRAMILLAEGKKEAAIREAEGQKQAAILKAEGEKQRQILIAEGQAQAIKKVLEALKMADEKYLTLQYIEKLPDLAKYGNLIVPYDTEALIGLLRVLQKVKDTPLPKPPEPPKEEGKESSELKDEDVEKLKNLME
ncbi:SPFH domain-containing protein [Thermococcus gammatolerans]|uniref:Prokaryotic stomatin n=1 Tax=Thermococcus gammatolerans (strain DSM 15229 / JCM 11827 / EJ3) TaxID=593117 RepID=C5A450_THEGJ|nr:SPFH domain-containing protein [Thermococcus gammatolerans]ACS33012.1 Prohibitin/Stomatin-like protein [Thermococcus gammatolerans EJ3]